MREQGGAGWCGVGQGGAEVGEIYIYPLAMDLTADLRGCVCKWPKTCEQHNTTGQGKGGKCFGWKKIEASGGMNAFLVFQMPLRFFLPQLQQAGCTTRLGLLLLSPHFPLSKSHPAIPNSEYNYDCDDRSLHKFPNDVRWNVRRLPSLLSFSEFGYCQRQSSRT